MIDIQPDKQGLKDFAKEIRQQYEANGRDINVHPTGTPRIVHVDTAADDIAKLTALYVRENNGLIVYPLEFKGGGTFYTLSQTEFVYMVEKAYEFIEALYSTEKNLYDLIDTEFIKTRELVQYVFDQRML